MIKQYHVTLTTAERDRLQRLLRARSCSPPTTPELSGIEVEHRRCGGVRLQRAEEVDASTGITAARRRVGTPD